MKKGILLVLSAIVLVALTVSSFKPVEEVEDLVIIRTTESVGTTSTSSGYFRISVSNSGGTLETVGQERYHKATDFFENSALITPVLQKWYDKGYTSVTSNSGGASNRVITTYILKKE